MIQKQLFENQDIKYKIFSAKLIPNIDSEKVIGVRAPILKKMAKEYINTEIGVNFMKATPHQYLEENILHGYMINEMKDYISCIQQVEDFLPCIDNWAVNDIIAPPIFKKHTEELIDKIRDWLKSDLTYTVRFGGATLMRFYLDKKFKPEYLELMAEINSGEYYVNMMVAWFFATALAKQYEDAIKYIEKFRLDQWTHNKSIQKALESRRVTEEHKAYLKTLKIR